MAQTHSRQGAGQLLEGLAQNSPPQGWFERAERRDAADNPPLFHPARPRKSLSCQFTQQRFVITQNRRRRSETGTDGGIVFLQKRQQLVADAVTQEGCVAVAGIFSPLKAAGAEVLFDFGTGYFQQRANIAALIPVRS